MATEDKLKYFYDSTMTALKSMSERDIGSMKEKLDADLADYKKVHAREIENQELAQQDEIKRELLKELAGEKLKLRRAQSRKEAEIKDKLFEEVAAVLAEKMKTPEYVQALKEMIKSAVDFAEGDDMTIYICKKDEPLKEELEKSCGREISISPVLFEGGIQAEIPSRNIFINDSFSSRLADAKESYIVKA